ncbi:uncharacterized protein LOC119775267, partial [Cyprinodon tularosa]|uniref:uncharacterized protein LOC119775267 n=1 Tax=Cyprinodon tularosa TaxID=77115 RepID=UPI0018E206B6
TDAKAHVISQDISCFQRQINPGAFPGTSNPDSSTSLDSNHSIASSTISRQEDEIPEKGNKMKEKQMKNSHEYSQVLVVTHGKEKAAGLIKDDNSELANSSFTGQYNEEESARSFQAAVMQWRKERRDGTRKLVTTDALWTPFKPALVSATSTQTDLPSDKEAEGQKREGAEGKLIVKLEFSKNSLTHMERLLLKKHRRTPFESPRSQDFGMDLKPLPSIDTEEEMATHLTAEEEDFRQYCSSLFSVPVSKEMAGPQVSTSGLSLVIEDLDDICRDMMVSFAEQKLDNNRMVSEADDSSLHPAQPSITAAQPKTASVCTTSAQEAARTSKKSAKSPFSNYGSPQFSSSSPDSPFSTPMPPLPPVLTSTDVSVVDGPASVIPEEHLFSSSSTPFSLRSTFSVSPSDSAQQLLLPKFYHSTPQQQDSKHEMRRGGLSLMCEEDSCREKAPTHLPSQKLREMNDQEMCHPDDSFRPAKETKEKDLENIDKEQQQEPQMVMRNQTAEFGSEQLCDLDGFSPLGFDMDTSRPDSPKQTLCDELHTCQFLERDSDPTGCSVSQASQVVTVMCSVELSGCEDPDLDNEITAHLMHNMEQELKLVANTQFNYLGMDTGDSGKEIQDESGHFKWDVPSKKHDPEEETLDGDRQSVLLLP